VDWSIEADTEFDLFMFSDAPIVERLHFNRTLISEGA
jgi:gentisate 1,2-dioxygenase